MKLDLNTRNLQTGEREQKVFESEDAAFEFLKNRPKFWEVLGVASHDVPPELNRKLRDAMRPLDPEEKLLEQQLEAAMVQVERERAEKRSKEAAAQAEKHRKEMATADPNRPMKLRYRFNDDLCLADPSDPRTITDEGRAAIMAWVEERTEWVKDRGQIIGDATVTVYPGPLPDGVSERVESGTFIPVTGPAEDD
jgi:hypothetical protein